MRPWGTLSRCPARVGRNRGEPVRQVFGGDVGGGHAGTVERFNPLPTRRCASALERVAQHNDLAGPQRAETDERTDEPDAAEAGNPALQEERAAHEARYK